MTKFDNKNPPKLTDSDIKAEFIKNPLNLSFQEWLLKHGANSKSIMLELSLNCLAQKYTGLSFENFEVGKRIIQRGNFEFNFFTVHTQNKSYFQRGDVLLYDFWIVEREARLQKAAEDRLLKAAEKRQKKTASGKSIKPSQKKVFQEGI